MQPEHVAKHLQEIVPNSGHFFLVVVELESKGWCGCVFEKLNVIAHVVSGELKSQIINQPVLKGRHSLQPQTKVGTNQERGIGVNMSGQVDNCGRRWIGGGGQFDHAQIQPKKILVLIVVKLVIVFVLVHDIHGFLFAQKQVEKADNLYLVMKNMPDISLDPAASTTTVGRWTMCQ